MKESRSISYVLSLLLITNFESKKQSKEPKSMSSLNTPSTNNKQRSTNKDLVFENVTIPNQGHGSWVIFKQSVLLGVGQLSPLFLSPLV